MNKQPKRIVFVVTILVFITLLLSSCGQKQGLAISSTDENSRESTVANMYGNSAQNIASNGFVAQQGDWIYYKNNNDNNTYQNFDLFSTNFFAYHGYIGEGPCGSPF